MFYSYQIKDRDRASVSIKVRSRLARISAQTRLAPRRRNLRLKVSLCLAC